MLLKGISKLFRFVPLAITVFLIHWATYVNFTIFYAQNGVHVLFRIIEFALTGVLYLLLVFTCFKVVALNAGQPWSRFGQYSYYKPISGQNIHNENNINVTTLDDLEDNATSYSSSNGKFDTRYCEICQYVKPSRAHHCSTCDTCILKMDHHCIWFNNCVGLYNYRYFIQFLSYTVLMSLWSLSFTLDKLILFFSSNPTEDDYLTRFNLQWLLLCAASALFGIVVGIFWAYHIYLLLNNRTTLESLSFSDPEYASTLVEDDEGTSAMANLRAIQEAPMKPKFNTLSYSDLRKYDRGRYNNIKEVMGNKFIFWILPLPLKEELNFSG